MYNDEYEQGYDLNNQDDYESHTGDPNLDEQNRQQYKIPETVKNFLVYFRNNVNEGLVFELQALYEHSWPKLTEDYFEKRAWPEESEVAAIVDADPVFIILYKELYFRHIYARIQGGPTLEQRFNSFYNYCDLFNYILSAEEPVPLELPDLWLWELIDEFVYQFQSFAQYRARLQKKTKLELATLNSNNKVWNVLCVLNVLHSLVDKSNIKQQLEVYASGGDPDSVAGEFGSHSLYKMLGYFSLVGLLRLHSLLGDYYQAIKVLENIEVHKKSQYAHIPACQISTSYYVGFAYMMMRRYSDAIRTFSSILLYIQRTKQLFAAKTYQHDQINKQTDQMYHLLAICLVLHPQCIDESIQQTLRERSYHEKMYKMQYGDLQEMCIMATNNYFGFTHGGTQYSATTGAAYQAGQPGYAVAAAPATAAAATYGTQRAAGYDTAYQAAAATQGTYAAVGTGATPAYEYGYGQTAAATYAGSYEQAAAAAAKPATYATTYATQRAATQQVQAATAAAKPAQYTAPYQPNATAYQATYAQPAAQTTIAAQPTTQAKQTKANTYSGYDAALYSAATMYVAQQQHAGGVQTAGQPAVATKTGGGGWQGFKRGAGANNRGQRPKAPPKPQQLHYCDVCKISCAGPQTYREHLEGQKHKKREAATKMAAAVTTTSANRSGNSLRCQLCDVTCTGNDAYAAHIRGAKHQKVVLLHTKLGKPIPPQEPEVIGGAKKSIAAAPKINFVQSGGLGVNNQNQGSNGDAVASKEEEAEETPEPDIQPVGQDYIEEIKSDDGKVMSFNCKLCECRFNDPNAKEMHMKGRRHRLQYKKKVNPDLVVDVKPSLRQRKIQEEKMRRAAMREEFWARRHGFNMDDEESMYWEDRRRYEEYMEMVGRGGPFGRGRPFPGGPPFFPGGPGPRRAESSDDRHVMAKHTEIYPKEEELQIVQRIVSHTERALKQVSDQLAEAKPAEGADGAKDKSVEPPQKEDGRDNQLFSFQKEQDATRMLRGVMRVGHLAKGLLLKGDNHVELVVLCADKPTLTLLKKVVDSLPAAFKQIAPESTYQIMINPAEAGLTVQSEGLTVLVQLTSPVMRDQEAASGGSDRDVLSRGKCLQALAALRHTKWFQARALGLHSCVVIIRILRDLCQRVPTWSPLSSWAMELLAEKVISSTPGQVQLSPGDALRRVMEAVAGGLLLPGGPGLADPCEKDGPDAAGALNAQQREDLTCSAQYALRLIAFRQIYKVLGMDPLPAPQKSFRRDRSARKRRRSGGEQEGSESDTGKMVKTEGAAAATEGKPVK